MGSGSHCAQLRLPDEQLRVPASPGTAPEHRPGVLLAPDLLQDSVGPMSTGQGAVGRHLARVPSQGPVWPLSAPGGLSALRTRQGVGGDGCPALECPGDGHRGSREAGEHTVLLRACGAQPTAPSRPHRCPRAISNQIGAPCSEEGGRVESRPLSPGIRLTVGEARIPPWRAPCSALRREPRNVLGRLLCGGSGEDRPGAPPRGRESPQAHTRACLDPVWWTGAAQRLEEMRAGQAGRPLPWEVAGK